MSTNNDKLTNLNNWEKFEVESCDYLNNLYNDLPVSFQEGGGRDSITSDIKVCNKQDELFSIEAKYSPSQSGQFVVKENEGQYSLSDETISKENQHTQTIINYLNDEKEKFSPQSQKAVDIDLNQEILSKWIIEHYKNKDSYFIITSNKLDDYKAIIPIDELLNFFDVSAVIRRKRSGTSHVAKYKIEESLSALNEHAKKINLNIKKVHTEAQKTLAIFNEDKILNKSDQYFGELYFLSPNNSGPGYYIKTRSQTNNLNIIFSLRYKGNKSNIGKDALKEFILKLLKNK